MRRRKSKNHQVLSNLTIWFWALILVLVAVGSVWGMLYFFGNDPKGSTRLEAIRIASTVVVGTGGAAALLLAARRQRFSELDGTERRITELQTKAAEQLGHEKAAVRLAGLHSLERLANDHPSHRQTIVDIICAYLRMPFTPPPDRLPARPIAGNLRNRREPAWQRRSFETSVSNSLIEERFQEQQVRQTAQRILQAHLTPNRRWKKSWPRNPYFWKDIRLDLSGATLENLDLARCEITSGLFNGCHFIGRRTCFSFACVRGGMLFRGAKFSANKTNFSFVRFHGAVTAFDHASFDGTTDFRYAWIASAAFRNTSFAVEPELEGARFGVKEREHALAPPLVVRARAEGGYELTEKCYGQLWDFFEEP